MQASYCHCDENERVWGASPDAFGEVFSGRERFVYPAVVGMPATWINFDPYTDPYEQWKVIDDFTSSGAVVVIEYRSDESDSPLCGRHGLAHWDLFSDIVFGTVRYAQVRHAAAREGVMVTGTIVVYAYGTQVGQCHKGISPHPEELIERARELLAE